VRGANHGGRRERNRPKLQRAKHKSRTGQRAEFGQGFAGSGATRALSNSLISEFLIFPSIARRSEATDPAIRAPTARM